MESVSADGQFVLQSVMTVASVPSTPTAVQCDNAWNMVLGKITTIFKYGIVGHASLTTIGVTIVVELYVYST